MSCDTKITLAPLATTRRTSVNSRSTSARGRNGVGSSSTRTPWPILAVAGGDLLDRADDRHQRALHRGQTETAARRDLYRGRIVRTGGGLPVSLLRPIDRPGTGDAATSGQAGQQQVLQHGDRRNQAKMLVNERDAERPDAARRQRQRHVLTGDPQRRAGVRRVKSGEDFYQASTCRSRFGLAGHAPRRLPRRSLPIAQRLLAAKGLGQAGERERRRGHFSFQSFS